MQAGVYGQSLPTDGKSRKGGPGPSLEGGKRSSWVGISLSAGVSQLQGEMRGSGGGHRRNQKCSECS